MREKCSFGTQKNHAQCTIQHTLPCDICSLVVWQPLLKRHYFYEGPLEHFIWKAFHIYQFWLFWFLFLWGKSLKKPHPKWKTIIEIIQAPKEELVEPIKICIGTHPSRGSSVKLQSHLWSSKLSPWFYRRIYIEKKDLQASGMGA